MIDVVDPAPAPAWGEPGYDPLVDLWARVGRPYEVNATVGAVVGMSPAVAAQLAGLVLATSAEAEDLLDRFPTTVRSLATSVHAHAERCIGSLRGPVLWSETISARAASFGDDGLFVCAAPGRAYDTDENQVLVAALVHVRDAGKAATEGLDAVGRDDERLQQARRNGLDAGRFAEHPSLQRVTRRRPTPRALKRTRSRNRRTYAPALAMLARAAEPIGPDDLRPWCDERTRAQLHVLMGLVHRLEATGGTLPPFRAERGGLYAGPVQFFHPRALLDRATPSGIMIGSVLVDVPDRLHDPSRSRAQAALAARAGGRTSMVITDDDDLDAAVARAITLARPSA